MSGPTLLDLVRVRASLAVGAPPAEALAAATDDVSRRVVAAVRVGERLEQVARRADLPPSAAWLVRALAIAERCGQGAVDAVDIAVEARQDAELDDQRLASRTAQAAGTARLLTILPVAAWVLLLALDTTVLRFLGTSLGLACAIATVALAAAGHWWSCRLIGRAARAAALADPLASRRAPFDHGRAAVVTVPVAATTWVLVSPLPALVAGVVTAGFAGRRAPPSPPPCSSVELVHLLRMAISAGVGVAAAVEHVAAVSGDGVADRLRPVAAQLARGCAVDTAFAAAGLDEIGAVLAVTERWGVAPAEPLRLLGDTVRARRRAASEAASERVQLALVFPTTLLTLPAFVLAVVPPLIWTALGG